MFSEWINQKYSEWQRQKTRKESTIEKFAAEFGTSQSNMSRWMSPGSHPPKAPKYLNALKQKYGDEFLQVLGIEPDTSPHQISLDQVPSELRSVFEAAITELTTTFTAKGIDPDSPAGLALAKEIFDRHGFNIVKSNVKSG